MSAEDWALVVALWYGAVMSLLWILAGSCNQRLMDARRTDTERHIAEALRLCQPLDVVDLSDLDDAHTVADTGWLA